MRFIPDFFYNFCRNFNNFLFRTPCFEHFALFFTLKNHENIAVALGYFFRSLPFRCRFGSSGFRSGSFAEKFRGRQ